MQNVNVKLNDTLILTFLAISCIISEVYLSYGSIIGPFPLRIYFSIIAIGLLLLGFCLKNKRTIALPFPLQTLLFFIVLATGLSIKNLLGDAFAINLIKLLLVPLINFTIVYSIIKNRPTLFVTITKVIVITVAVSAFVAIMQGLHFELFWRLREMLPSTTDDIINKQLQSRSRPPGLSYFAISFGYQCLLAFPLCYWLASISQKKVFYNTLAVIIVLGVFFSQTRSSLLGIVIEFSALNMFADNKLNKQKIYSILKLGAGFSFFILLLFFLKNQQRFFMLDSSAYSRIALFYTGIIYIFTHPLGAHFEWSIFFQWRDTNMPYIAFLASKTEALSVASSNTPHNQFINTAILYGWLGLLALVYFYVHLYNQLKYCSTLDNNNKKLNFALGIGLLGYVIHSLFHNAGPFIGDAFHWYYMGLLSGVIWLQKAIYGCNCTFKENLS